jgi:hypothetical protein
VLRWLWAGRRGSRRAAAPTSRSTPESPLEAEMTAAR